MSPYAECLAIDCESIKDLSRPEIDEEIDLTTVQYNDSFFLQMCENREEDLKT